MIVTDRRVLEFVSQRLGLFPESSACIGLVRGGAVVTGVVFNNFEGTDIHITVAGSVWTRPLLRAVGDYVFRQLGCIRMTAITENDRVLDLSLRCGGMIEGRMRNHFGRGRDGIVIGFLKEEWRYGFQTPPA